MRDICIIMWGIVPNYDLLERIQIPSIFMYYISISKNTTIQYFKLLWFLFWQDFFLRQEVTIYTFFNCFCFWLSKGDESWDCWIIMQLLVEDNWSTYLIIFLLKDKTLLNTLREEHYDLALVDLIGKFFCCD